LLLAPAAHAWNGDGHRIICAIAWDELKPFARESVQTVLALQTRDQFADTCTWADQPHSSQPNTRDWHFVDVAFGENYVRLARDCGTQQTCALAQINLAISELDGGPAEANKAEALKWLANLVGDIHDPLNVTHPGLRTLKGRFMGRAMTLAEVWSGGLSNTPWREAAGAIARDITEAQRELWRSSRPIQWADESLVIANDLALAHEGKPPFALDRSYAAKYLPTVHQRYARAGVRLAYLLNTIYAGR
jgi:hypothetical protein